MYQLMMELPLFNGAGFDKMSEIFSFSRISFQRHMPGDTILKAGDLCDEIVFILRGQVRSTILTKNRDWAISQTLSAPNVLNPDFLFGLDTRNPATATAQGECATATIVKADYLRILNTDSVFLFNFVNRLSKDAQKSILGLQNLDNNSIAKRLALWVGALTDPTGTDITIECNMDPANEIIFGVKRSEFTASLDELARVGLIEYTPGRIKVLNRRTFLEKLLPDLTTRP